MRVSIITATFNSAKTIADTLDSVNCQTYDDIEHLIIDGLSKDETIAIVKEKSPSARCVSEKDQGIYDAMNKGIGLATGDVIGVLNSDDFYAGASVIADVVSLFEKEQCDAVYGDLVYVDAKEKSRVVRNWKGGAFKPAKFLFGWMPPHPTFFVRRSVYEHFGVFDTSLKSSADYELMLRFLFRHRISAAYLPKCLVCMRTGGQSNASFANRLKANKEDRLAWKKNGLEPRFYTTLLKPIRKIPQFIQ